MMQMSVLVTVKRWSGQQDLQPCSNAITQQDDLRNNSGQSVIVIKQA